jgi:hypothetical protein
MVLLSLELRAIRGGRTRVPWVVRVLVSIAVAMALPRIASAQEGDRPSLLRVDAHLGLVEHDGGIVTGGVNAYQAEIVLRSRGPVVLGVGAGLINTGSYDVILIQPITEFEGQPVLVSGRSSSYSYSPRFRGLAGYAFEVAPGLWFEPTVEGGFAQMAGPENEWEPWTVGALSLRGTSGIGAQLGIGRHRVGVTYLALGSRAVVHEFSGWEKFTELLVSFPLN